MDFDFGFWHFGRDISTAWILGLACRVVASSRRAASVINRAGVSIRDKSILKEKRLSFS